MLYYTCCIHSYHINPDPIRAPRQAPIDSDASEISRLRETTVKRNMWKNMGETWFVIHSCSFSMVRLGQDDGSRWVTYVLSVIQLLKHAQATQTGLKNQKGFVFLKLPLAVMAVMAVAFF